MLPWRIVNRQRSRWLDSVGSLRCRLERGFGCLTHGEKSGRPGVLCVFQYSGSNSSAACNPEPRVSAIETVTGRYHHHFLDCFVKDSLCKRLEVGGGKMRKPKAKSKQKRASGTSAYSCRPGPYGWDGVMDGPILWRADDGGTRAAHRQAETTAIHRPSSRIQRWNPLEKTGEESLMLMAARRPVGVFLGRRRATKRAVRGGRLGGFQLRERDEVHFIPPFLSTDIAAERRGCRMAKRKKYFSAKNGYKTGPTAGDPACSITPLEDGGGGLSGSLLPLLLQVSCRVTVAAKWRLKRRPPRW